MCEFTSIQERQRFMVRPDDGSITQQVRAELPHGEHYTEELLLGGSIAVSYTHLDVYKRQVSPFSDSLRIHRNIPHYNITNTFHYIIFTLPN